MLGKQKCKILKEIRRRIAEENDIPYVTRECRHRGDCAGTCPRCESELRYLEQQLALRASLGKRAAVVALCAGMTLAAAGCAPRGLDPGGGRGGTELSGAVAYREPLPTEKPVEWDIAGEIAWPEEPCDADLPPEEGESPAVTELMGDVAWLPGTEDDG